MPLALPGRIPWGAIPWGAMMPQDGAFVPDQEGHGFTYMGLWIKSGGDETIVCSGSDVRTKQMSSYQPAAEFNPAKHTNDIALTCFCKIKLV